MDLNKLRSAILVGAGIIGVFLAAVFAKNLVDSKAAAVVPAKIVVKEAAISYAKNGPVPIYINAQGLVNAKQKIELYAEVQGIFKPGDKLFRTGQSYGLGETLLQIDASEFLANVKASRNNLHNQIAAILPDIRLDFPNNYQAWASFLKRIDIEKNIPALPEMDTEDIRLFISGRGILTAYYNLKNLEQRLSKFSIRAPFNGVLTEALVREGTLVRSGQKLGEFMKPGVYELLVSVPQSFSKKLRKGAIVALENLEGTKSYTGFIRNINAKVDPNTQTTAIMIETTDAQLSDGVYVSAKLQGNEMEQAISLPRALVRQDGHIYTVKDNVLQSLAVHVVHYSEDQVVVTGIPDGTAMLAKPIMGAYEGMPVKVTP